METKELAKKATDNKVNNNPVTVDNKNQKFVAGNVVNKDSAKAPEPAKEGPKGGEPAKPEPVKEQPKAEAPKADEVKPTAAPQPQKVVMNLEQTLKFVEDLHRRKIQRDKLLETINNLEAFEVDLKDEADETGGNHFSGCVLTLMDDDNRKFTTKNPTIIWTVAQMVNNLCVNKLAEIESGITIPQ